MIDGNDRKGGYYDYYEVSAVHVRALRRRRHPLAEAATAMNACGAYCAKVTGDPSEVCAAGKFIILYHEPAAVDLAYHAEGGTVDVYDTPDHAVRAVAEYLADLPPAARIKYFTGGRRG